MFDECAQHHKCINFFRLERSFFERISLIPLFASNGRRVWIFYNGGVDIKYLRFLFLVVLLFHHPANAERMYLEVSTNTDFLKKLHKIVISPSLTPENIAAIFGWRPLERKQPDEQPYWTQDYETPFYPQVKLAVSSGKGNIYDLSIILNQSACVSGDDVLAEFGNDYERIVIAYDKFSEGEKSNQSESKPESIEVGRNRERFMGGPIYRIENKDSISKITFNFSGQKCFDSIEIVGPRYQGVNQ